MQIKGHFRPASVYVNVKDFFDDGNCAADQARVSLDEALQEGMIEMVQVDHFNGIPQVRISNHSFSKILLFKGEEITGKKKNRLLTITITLQQNANVVVPALFLTSTPFFDQDMVSIQHYLQHFTAMDNRVGVVFKVNGQITGQRYGDFSLHVEVSYSKNS